MHLDCAIDAPPLAFNLEPRGCVAAPSTCAMIDRGPSSPLAIARGTHAAGRGVAPVRGAGRGGAEHRCTGQRMDIQGHALSKRAPWTSRRKGPQQAPRPANTTGALNWPQGPENIHRRHNNRRAYGYRIRSSSFMLPHPVIPQTPDIIVHLPPLSSFICPPPCHLRHPPRSSALLHVLTAATLFSKCGLTATLLAANRYFTPH